MFFVWRKDHVKETNQTFDRSATVGRLTLNRRLVTAATESLLQENNWRKSQMRFIGVDLHSNRLTVCYLSENGSEEMRTFDLKELVKFQASLAATDELAVKYMRNAVDFKDAVESVVSDGGLVNVSQVGAMRTREKNADRHDARILALFLSKDMLPEARLKQPAQAEVNSVAHT